MKSLPLLPDRQAACSNQQQISKKVREVKIRAQVRTYARYVRQYCVDGNASSTMATLIYA